MAGQIELTDVGFGDFVHEQRNERFPLYTRGNAGEVWPEVVYPLSIDMGRRVGVEPLIRPALKAGLITRDEVGDDITVFGAVFGGYMFLNLSFLRLLAVRTPGAELEANDAMYLGTEGIAPPYEPHPDDKSLRASLGAIRYTLQLMRLTELPKLDENERRLAELRRTFPSVLQGSDKDLLAFMRGNVETIYDMFAWHLEVSGAAGGSVQVLTRLCRDLLDDERLALTLLGGIGDIASAAPAVALWDLGRTVRDDPVLTAAFDDGIDGLEGRLRGQPEADAFVMQFDAFLDEFGSRGPNEWEAASPTWGIDRNLPLALIDRMRTGDDRQDPRAQAERLARDRVRAEADTRGKLNRVQRWFFDRSLRSAVMFSRAREQAKTTVIGVLHLSRLALWELGRRVAERTPGASRDDLFFLLDRELDAWLENPTQFADTIAERRRVRNELVGRVPPFVTDGSQPDPSTWPLRDAESTVEMLAVGETVSGLAGCPGVAEGRARIVTDPADPGDLGPGDILVAPLTDPAWTPLFVPSEGVVVSVGGQMSHAMIVSRELGLPCVVGIADATERIPDGAIIRVDGDTGTVTVVSV